MAANKRKVTKQEAATTQLETAIKLHLENRDQISAYTLSAAAQGILEGIYKNERTAILDRQRQELDDPKYFRFSWREELEIRFKPEHIKEGFRYLNRTQNYFKHADNDHDTDLDFADFEQTGLQIFTTVTNHRLVFREISPAMSVFFAWFMMLHPNLLGDDNPLTEHIVGIPLLEGLHDRFSNGDLAAMGNANLKATCPELFREYEPEIIMGPPRSGVAIPVPSKP